jgi:hypothetical protein
LLDVDSGSPAARAAARLTVARCAFIQGDFGALQQYADACIPVHRDLGDAHSEGFALMILGAATGTRGDTVRGVALLHEAVALSRASGDRWLEASCLGYLGIVLARSGDVVDARCSLEEGLTTARSLGDHRCVGWMLSLSVGSPGLPPTASTPGHTWPKPSLFSSGSATGGASAAPCVRLPPSRSTTATTTRAPPP